MDEKKISIEAIEPILHDGKRIMPGAEFEATPAQAERLVKARAAVVLGSIASDKKSDKAGK